MENAPFLHHVTGRPTARQNGLLTVAVTPPAVSLLSSRISHLASRPLDCPTRGWFLACRVLRVASPDDFRAATSRDSRLVRTPSLETAGHVVNNLNSL